MTFPFPRGTKLVASWAPPEPRKTADELRAMHWEDRLFHEVFGQRPLTEREQEAAMLREDELDRYKLNGELLVTSRLYDDGPPGDW